MMQDKNGNHIENADELLSENEEEIEKTSTEIEDIELLKQELSEANDKYVRLYADFENYKKIAARKKEELLKYANEDLLSDILTVIDHLELALQHSSEKDTSDALAEGVSLTLKELLNVLEKHGLVTIDALSKPFDPSLHHAMSQIEAEDAEDNTVVKEFRKGYILRDRVLRPSLVGVATKQSQSEGRDEKNDDNQTVGTDEV